MNLERGASVSNCKIKFNMPVLPAGSISVTKQFSGTDNYNDDYEFTIYDTTNEITQPVSNAKYIVDEQEYYTDENGKFYLKKDQTALFILNNYHSYYVEETNSGLHSKSLNCTLDEINCPYIDKTGEFTINPDSQYAIVFTNEVKKYNVNIDKIVYYNDSQDDFEFEFYLRDVNNLPVDIPDAINSEYLVDHVNGIVTFNLKNGENVTIRDIPIDTICTLKEINHDGYQVLIKNGDIILSNSHIYENFRIDSDKTMTVHNTPGVILPETGGNGILWYLFIGISLILISIKFGYKYLLSSNRNWV